MNKKYFLTIAIIAVSASTFCGNYFWRLRRNESRNELIKTSTDTGMLIFRVSLDQELKRGNASYQSVDSVYKIKRDSVLKMVLR